MQLSEDYLARSQTDPSNAFTLAPSPATVPLAQARQFADTRACSNGLNRRELANNLEVHDPIVAKMDDLVKLARISGLTEVDIRKFPKEHVSQKFKPAG